MNQDKLIEAVARVIKGVCIDYDRCGLHNADEIAQAAIAAHTAHLEANGLVIVPMGHKEMLDRMFKAVAQTNALLVATPQKIEISGDKG